MGFIPIILQLVKARPSAIPILSEEALVSYQPNITDILLLFPLTNNLGFSIVFNQKAVSHHLILIKTPFRQGSMNLVGANP